MTRILRLVVLLALMLATAGCAITTNDLKALSAGQTGCRPDQVIISNRTHVGVVGTTETWNATCKGKVYVCSGVDATQQYSCALASH